MLAEGDAEKVATMVSDLAERTQASNIDVLLKLGRSANSYMQQVTNAAMRTAIWRRNYRGCTCGCGTCDGEEEAADSTQSVAEEGAER